MGPMHLGTKVGNQHQATVTLPPHYPLLRPRWSSWLPSVVSRYGRLSAGSEDVGTRNVLACPRNSVKPGNYGEAVFLNDKAPLLACLGDEIPSLQICLDNEALSLRACG